ncbi:epsin-1-like isoform X1 [Cyprinus carpio]|uniref:Epsin-1-like isoform X1 n=1 Tax=Cyprinus carpio TaxID=7962 RepID=A0A9Q9X7A8_CYPCA|nr:epsin-1-like isoform X1 [Cyprinus carpio]
MSTSSLRRQVKNIVHNYSEAEIKVREATSNDPWGPSSSLMSEIADLTYNVVAFSEIMSMVWKRLNDHGKNWRHVYKAMTLMEYLIKTGSERVAQQCRENIYAVQTLKDFQYIDRDGKDQGVNVREKAKQLVTLLKDEERLREERIHALKTKEKMAQTSSASSAPSAPALGGGLPSGADAEQAWPQSTGEEDLQLQLALAMSKEEAEQTSNDPLEDADLRYALTVSQETHQKVREQKFIQVTVDELFLCYPLPLQITDQPESNMLQNDHGTIEVSKKYLEERLRRGDDLRLQMAIEESKREKAKPEESSLMELSAVDPWGGPATGSAGPSPPPVLAPASTAGPWGPADPWGAASPASPPSADPWGGAPATVAPDPWGDSSSRVNSDPWASTAVTPPSADPWAASVAPAPTPLSGSADPWAAEGAAPATDGLTSDPWSGSVKQTNGTADLERRGSSVTGGDAGGGGSTGSPVPFDLSSLSSSLPVRKTPESFLGPNAALVDLDSLVSSKPKPKQPPPPTISSTSHNPFLQTQGASSTGMGVTPGSTISSRGVSPTPPSASNPFGVTPMASISPQPSSLGLSQLRTSPIPQNPMLCHMPPPAMGMVQPGIGMPGMGVPMVAPGMGMGMVQSSPMGMPFGGISPMGPAGNPLLMGPGGPAQPALILGGPSGVGGVMGTGGSMGGGTTGTSTNPFLL